MNVRRFRQNGILVAPLWFGAAAAGLTGAESDRSAWQGIDETVVERIAVEAGRPPREPFLNTDQGDLLLFLFLLAGAAGGFVTGYCFRSLFPPRREKDTAPDA